MWKGESDAQPYIPDMVDDLIRRGIAHESQGAIVVDIAKEGDTKELPPCIVRKSDGAANYETSDLATLIERENYMLLRHIFILPTRDRIYIIHNFSV